MKIAHVLAVPATEERISNLKKLFSQFENEELEIDVLTYDDGPPDMEYYSRYLHAINLMIKDKDRLNQYNAISIACFYDPGLRELREVLDIPVVGIANASYILAQNYGHSFSVIVSRKKNIPKMMDNASLYGMDKKIRSWKSLDMSVQELKQSPHLAKEKAEKLVQEAIYEDGAEVIILGCGALSGIENELQSKYKIPIINPVIAGITCAKWLGELNEKLQLSTSKIYDFESETVQII